MSRKIYADTAARMRAYRARVALERAQSRKAIIRAEDRAGANLRRAKRAEAKVRDLESFLAREGGGQEGMAPKEEVHD
jgi:hypothetical protein